MASEEDKEAKDFDEASFKLRVQDDRSRKDNLVRNYWAAVKSENGFVQEEASKGQFPQGHKNDCLKEEAE